ncbi:MAG: glycosyltransferase family 4 protein [Saprospiraceae bacterium]
MKEEGRKLTLKVLHISSAITWRGGENQIRLLLNGLKGKCDNILFCPFESPLSQRIRNDVAQVIQFRKTAGISISLSFKIKKLCDNQKINIVHVHDSHAHNYAVGAALLGSKSSIIVTRRVDFIPSWISLYKYNHNSVKKVVSVSENIYNVLRKRGVDKRRLTTIYSAIDLAQKDKRKDLKKILNIEPQRKVIGFVGALVKHKDPITFIKMVHLLINEKCNYHFILVGNHGEYSEEVKKYIQKFRLGENISYLGFVVNMEEVWSTLDVLVITSKMEGLGSVALEAFNSKTAVVSTDAGGLIEIIKHNKNGLVSPVGDELSLKNNVKKILGDDALKSKLVNQGFEDVKNFGHLGLAKTYLSLYHK